MNTYMAHPSQHLTDEELLRLIDDEGGDTWRIDREAHIDACAECALALQALAADGDIIRDWLRHAAFEAGGTTPAAAGAAPRAAPRAVLRPVPAWLKAAAVVALVAAPVAALPGVRAWVGDIIDGGSREYAATDAPPAASTTAAIIRFAPDPGSFVVDLDVVQPAGELFVGRAAGADAVIEQTATASDAAPAAAQATEGGTATGPVVSPSSLRIRNDAGDSTGYVLHLPPGVTRVTVRVAGSVVAVLDGAAIDTGTTVRLHTP